MIRWPWPLGICGDQFDVVYNQSNAARIVELVEASDHLFIESAFLDTHKDMAAEKKHLTARQAGHLAAAAGVKQFSVFHLLSVIIALGVIVIALSTFTNDIRGQSQSETGDSGGGK